MHRNPQKRLIFFLFRIASIHRLCEESPVTGWLNREASSREEPPASMSRLKVVMAADTEVRQKLPIHHRQSDVEQHDVTRLYICMSQDMSPLSQRTKR